MFDLMAILDGLPDAVVVLSTIGEVRWANQAAEELLDDRLDVWLGRSVLDAVHPDDHAILINACATVVDKPVGALLSVRMQRPTGELIAVELRGRVFTHANDRSLVIVIRRIDDRDGLELVGNDATILHRLVHHAPAILAVLDDDLNLVSVNAAVTRLLGHDPAAVCGRPFVDLVEASERAPVRHALEHIDGFVCRAVSLWAVSGEVRHFALHATDLRAEAAVGRIVVTMSDVTDLRVAEQQLQIQADSDPLTGLLHRRSLEHQLDQLDTNRSAELAVMFLDIDQFKIINDVYGHDTGDRVLIEVAHRLRTQCGDPALIARVGGDEFVIAVPGENSNHVARLADHIAAAVARPISAADTQLCVEISIGVAATTTPCDPRTLISQADHRMYEVKHQRRTQRLETVDNQTLPRAVAIGTVRSAV